MDKPSVHVGVLGAGLIGGSICKSLRECGHADIHVFSQSASTVSDVEHEGFAVSSSIEELVASSDVLFICVPLDVQGKVFASVAQAISTTGRTDILVTDVSSVKGSEARDAIDLFESVGATFIPGHPMAGTEHSGFLSSTADMFVGATWVLCPERATPDQVLVLFGLIRAMNARVSMLDIDSHDAGVATISHLPYVVAASLLNVLSIGDSQSLALQLAAGSFRDGTRVAGSEPWLSASMITFNREHVQTLLTRFQGVLGDMQRAIENEDDEAVLAFFEKARSLRDEYSAVKLTTESTELSWPKDGALANLVAVCRAGALVHSITESGSQWSVLLEGKDLPRN